MGRNGGGSVFAYHRLFLKQKWIAIMKLSTLLLSSVALAVAGSAYAADLPAKKGAPAAKATGCPAFGAGFFQIPGGDNCIKFSGHMKYSGSYTTDSTANNVAAYSQSARFRLEADVRSNSEMGVVRGFGRINSASAATAVGKAYVQVGGLTAGLDSNLADISGTSGDNYGANLGGGSSTGVRYDMALGGSTLSVQVVNASNNVVSGVADRPDVLIGLATKAGPADVKIVAVSQEAIHASSATAQSSAQGYAVVARVGMTLGGGFGVAAFGGTSQAASKYTTSATRYDWDGTDKATGSNFGGEITFGAGSGTLAIAADQSKETLGAASTQVRNLGVSYAATLAKGLSVEPEFVTSTTDSTSAGKSTSNTIYIRIQRDF